MILAPKRLNTQFVLHSFRFTREKFPYGNYLKFNFFLIHGEMTLLTIPVLYFENRTEAQSSEFFYYSCYNVIIRNNNCFCDFLCIKVFSNNFGGWKNNPSPKSRYVRIMEGQLKSGLFKKLTAKAIDHIY